MKRLISLLIFFWASSVILFNTTYSFQEHWVRKPSPTTHWLYRCCFVDTLQGWAVGDSGTIIHTSNGGESWVIQNSMAGFSMIYDVFFVNQNTGWAVSIDAYGTFPSRILKTVNGGINWSSAYYPDTSVYLTTVFFLDPLKGFMGSLRGIMFKTTDGGMNWARLINASGNCVNSNVLSIRFLNPNFGLAAGGILDYNGVIWRSTNTTNSWTSACVGPELLNDVYFLDSMTVIAAGGDFEYGGAICKSTNGGINWSTTTFSSFGMCRRIARRTTGEFWITMGWTPNWAFSSDTAKTWTTLNTPENAALYDAVFKSRTFGIAVGSSGAIFKYDFAIGIHEPGEPVPTENRLIQNYPNPFNSSTIIEYVLAKDSKVKITLYDLLGRELKVLVNQPNTRGYHEVVFTADDMPSGIYVYTMQTDGYSESHKMVLLK